jgi:hypothetical protein
MNHPAAASTASFTPEQIAAAQAALDAAASRTPGPVLDAFFPDPVQLGALTFPPFTLASYMLLEKVGSPLLSGAALTAADITRAAVLLLAPAPEARRLAANPAALEDAAYALADRFPAAELQTLGTTLAEHLNRAFATLPGRGATPSAREGDPLGKVGISAPASAGA